MKWNDFFTAVKAGEFESFYVFTGPEEHTKREALETLRKALLPSGLEQLNDATLDGASAQTIIDSCETLPVMCERRIVTVRDWAPFLSGKAKNEDADVARILAWLENPPDSCVLVFYMSVEVSGQKKISSTLKKKNGWIEFSQLDDAALAKWCSRQFKLLGKSIGSDAIGELTMMAGRDLTRLLGEVQKLAAYTQDRPEVTAADIRAAVSPSPEYSVFMILDHLLAGRLAEATQVVNSVLQTEPKVARLIALFSNQLRIDTHMKYAIEERRPMPEVLKALRINEKRAYYIQRQIRNIPAEAFKERYLRCVEADYAIKSGKLRDRAALDRLMLQLVRN